MDLVSAALLGVVQGLTEFLPVSSSGHLILARAFFGWDPGRFGIAFDAACHVGTMAAVIVFFRDDIVRLAAAAPGALAWRDGEWERLGRLIVAGTIPIVIVGGLFEDAIEARLRTPIVVMVMLVVGSIVMIAAERAGRQNRGAGVLGMGEAFLIGMAQAAALAPGLSRSGATISVSMFLGVRRDSAARFVFLMSLPAIVAVAAKQAYEISGAGIAGVPVTLLAVGFSVSAVVGYFTVKYFVHYLGRHSMSVFVYYRLALAALTGLWLLAR